VDNDHFCKNCPKGADNCAGNKIDLKDGYWRSNNKSDIIVPCTSCPFCCDGEFWETGYCKDGHTGPLCNNCDNLAK